MASWSRPARNMTIAAASTLAFGVSAAFSVFTTREANGIASIWLASGFLTAALLVLDRRWAFGVAAVCYLINVAIVVAMDGFMLRALVFPAIRLGEAVLTAWLARFACGPSVRLTSLSRILRLLIMAVAPATAAASLLRANCWTTLGRNFDGVLASGFYADALGMALVLPAALLIRQRRRGLERPAWEQAALYAVLAGLTAATFSYTKFPLQLIMFPAAILVASRLGAQGAAIGSLVIAAVALVGLISHPVSGLNEAWTLPERIRLLQFLVGLVFFSSLATAMALGTQERLRVLWAGRSRIARRAEARAQAANLAKAEFLATMGHEIRTPMNSIVGFAQVLLKREDLAAPARRQLDLIERAGASLMTAVDDILMFSNTESRQIELTPKPYTARAVAQDALAIVREAAREKNLALDLTVSGGGDDLVMMDDLRVRQILLNLLGNAIKFTETGRVRLDVQPQRRDGGTLRFTVTDTGVGIPDEKIGQLFQQFSRLDSSTTRAFNGAGLGLAISKMLVEAMGGRIGVERGAVLGSVFWFEIPAEGASMPPAAPAPRPQALDARILLVDDHDANRELGVTVLRLLGCDVDTAKDGLEAVAAARTSVYDAILMDIHMPRMDGLDAARTIRGLGGDVGRTPIIAMSADVTPDMSRRCVEAGMVDAVGKPIQITALYSVIGKWIGRCAETETETETEAKAKAHAA